MSFAKLLAAKSPPMQYSLIPREKRRLFIKNGKDKSKIMDKAGWRKIQFCATLDQNE